MDLRMTHHASLSPRVEKTSSSICHHPINLYLFNGGHQHQSNSHRENRESVGTAHELLYMR
jgi:hypothetical protein